MTPIHPVRGVSGEQSVGAAVSTAAPRASTLTNSRRDRFFIEILLLWKCSSKYRMLFVLEIKLLSGIGLFFLLLKVISACGFLFNEKYDSVLLELSISLPCFPMAGFGHSTVKIGWIFL